MISLVNHQTDCLGYFQNFVITPGLVKKYLYTYILAESPGKIEQDKIPTFHKLKLTKNVGHIVFWGEKQCCNKVIMLPSQPFYCLATDIRKGLFHPVLFLSQSRTKQTNKQPNRARRYIRGLFLYLPQSFTFVFFLFLFGFYQGETEVLFFYRDPQQNTLLPSSLDSHKPPGFSLFLWQQVPPSFDITS